MRIYCRHGYFLFEETEPGDMGRFSSVYDVDLVKVDHYYTFETLSEAEKYSLAGKMYLNLPALETFEGEPWEVFEQNGFVYSIELDIIQPVESVTTMIKIAASDFYYVSRALIQPGSLLQTGQKVVDYNAWFDWRSSVYRYTELGFL
jgi:hypothetical protein